MFKLLNHAYTCMPCFQVYLELVIFICLSGSLIIIYFAEPTLECLPINLSFNIVLFFCKLLFASFYCLISCLLIWFLFFSSVQPDTLGALPNLRELWLDRNQLSSLPPVSADSIWLAHYHTGHLSWWFKISSSDKGSNSCRCCPFQMLFAQLNACAMCLFWW